MVEQTTPSSPVEAGPSYSLLIRGGRVIDGTGNPWFAADIAVRDGRIKLLRGNTTQVRADRVIDATGFVVCPGFIDVHSHSGLIAMQDPPNEAKVRQGVTTELVGVDGLSYAPFPSAADFSLFAELNAGLDGHPPPGHPWSSVAGYLDALEGRTLCNVACLIGNSALRIATTGWEDRGPTSDEARRMQELLRTGMREGAFGLSTGLTYPPGSYADLDEIAALCRTVSEEGGVYVTHVRYTLGDRFLDPYLEAIEVGRRSGAPVHISHLHSPRPGGARRLLALVDQALDAKLDVTFDSYPYPYSSSRLVALVPEWAHEGGARELMKRLRSKSQRAEMAEDPVFAARDPSFFLVTNFTRKNFLAYDGWSLGAIAEALHRSTMDTLCHLLVEERLGLSYVGLGGNPVNIRQFYQHPAHMVGSDALLLGRWPNPRSHGTYPMVLGQLCKDEVVLTLPEAVRKMTSFPAQRLGLRDRGVLRDGLVADLAIFDPHRVQSRASLESPLAYPEGIDYVIVNGELVIDGGVYTGARPGRALRHG
jgi:N-acyl-D-amino-acid deacylase